MARTRRDGAGGIRGLVRELELNGEAIDADLQREYGLSVADVVAGRVSLRRLRGLLRGMPIDGTAVWREQRRSLGDKPGKATPPPPEWWSAERDLLVSINDGLRVLAWQRTKDAAEGRGFPKPTPRPGQVAERPAALPPEEARRRLALVAGRDPSASPAP